MPEQSQGLAPFGERLRELTDKLKQSVVEGSEEDFKKALEQIVGEFFEQMFPRAFEQAFPRAMEHMPEAILKVWIEKPEFRLRLSEIQQEYLPTIVEALPEDWRSDPKFFMALKLIGFLPFMGVITGPLEYSLRSLAWKQDRLGPTLEHAVKAILQVDEESYGFFVKDETNRYVYVNKAMEVLLERPKSDIEGRTDAEIYDKKDAEILAVEFEKALQGNLIRRTQTRRVGKKNKTFLEVFVAKRDPWDMPVGIYGICRDITEHGEPVRLAEITDRRYPSRTMRKVLAECLLAAETDSRVLLLGETGSGKEYLARYIHNHSKRAGKPFWPINLAAIPATLVESELFGYEKGSHDKAHDRKRGQLELAEGGTLLLDEIGDFPRDLQPKLLTFLDDMEFTRLGGTKKIKIDSRIIAATNQEVYHEREQGNFRRDLFFRLNVHLIRVPPLRERTEDIPVLVKELIPTLAKELSVSAPTAVTPEAIESLSRYNWPGNVRELRNILERAVGISRGEPITTDMLKFGDEPKSEEEAQKGIGQGDKSSLPLFPEGHREMDLVKDVFLGLSEKQQGYHLDIMVNQLCGGQSGAVKYVSELLKMSAKTVKNRLKLVTEKEVATGNPGLGARDRMVPKLQKYLVDEILNPTR